MQLGLAGADHSSSSRALSQPAPFERGAGSTSARTSGRSTGGGGKQQATLGGASKEDPSGGLSRISALKYSALVCPQQQ